MKIKDFSKRFLAILVRLRLLSKIVLLILVLFSCKQRIYVFPDVEMICPNGYTMIIKHANLHDVRNAILKVLEEKRINKTSENYTIISLPDKRSVKIEKESPEDAIKCTLRELNNREVDRIYLYGE